MTYSIKKTSGLVSKGGIFVLAVTLSIYFAAPAFGFTFKTETTSIDLDNSEINEALYQISPITLNSDNSQRQIGINPSEDGQLGHTSIAPSNPDPKDWVLLDRQSPHEGFEATLTYDPNNNRAILFGGVYCEDNHCYYGNYTWSLKLESDKEDWKKINSIEAPPVRAEHSTIYDSSRERVIVFGGEDSLSTYLKDTWALSLNQGQEEWQQLNPTGININKLSRNVAVYDSIRDRMIVFSGAKQTYGNPFYQSTREIQVLDFSNSPQGEWQKLYPEGPYPAQREGAVAMFDPIKNRMIVFGGYGGGNELNDTWALDFSNSEAGEWINLNPGGNVPDARWNAAGTYDPIHKLFIIFGGVEISQGKSYNDLYVLSTRSNNPNWIKINPEGITPEERGHHQVIFDQENSRPIIYGGGLNEYGFLLDPKTAVHSVTIDGGSFNWERIKVTGEQHREYYGEMVSIYDPTRDRIIMHGGIRSGFWPTILEDQVYTIEFENGQPVWRFYGNSEIDRSNHNAIYDELNNRMVFFGGQNGTDDPINKVHYLDLSSEDNEWQTIDVPAPFMNTRLSGSTAIYDPIGHRMIVFGGAINPEYIENNDIWAFDLTIGEEEWYQIIPEGLEPHERCLHTAIYDPVNHQMIIYGGWDNTTINDIWALDLTEGQESWTELETTGEFPEPHYNHTAMYDSKRHQMVIFGGLTGNNDLQALDLNTFEWSKLDPIDEPPPAQNGVNLIYDPVRDRAIFLSGCIDGDRSDDTYLLLNLDF